MKKEKSKNSRTRNYACVLYPDSAVENWKEVLQSHMVQSFISPLHDKDINPDGSVKKAHYHVLLMFDGPKTIEQAEEVFNSVNGVGCEVVKSLRGYARYLCHLDNPEKYQYDTSDVISICGADYLSIIGLAIDKYIAISEMQDFCQKYDISSFYVLSEYARKHKPDWHRILCDSGAIFLREYLKSRYWTINNTENISIIDKETGEVIFFNE